jgi:hypothetical protein
MNIEMIDKSGMPRSIQEISEASAAIKKAFVKFEGPPSLMIHYTTIIEALDELLNLRKSKGT